MSLRIAVASGKGGTGKTTIATSLAAAYSRQAACAAYLDCDVEEPNGGLFLHPRIDSKEPVTRPVPNIDEQKCTHCNACARACRFSALVGFSKKLLTFPDLCHACGGCSLACDQDAIVEVPYQLGEVAKGSAGDLEFVQGLLSIGKPSAVPIIQAVTEHADAKDVKIIDSPPGTSCSMIEAVKDSDVILLVTEPTPFGLADLRLAVEVIRSLGVPFGVAVNKAGVGDDEVWRWCESEGIQILLEIPYDRLIAEAYSRGELIIDTIDGMDELFSNLIRQLEKMAKQVRSRAEWDFSPSSPDLPPAKKPSERLEDGEHPKPKEVVVISGKGGAGKTSICASLVALSNESVIADCDVDAADLYLVLDPEDKGAWPHTGGFQARVRREDCTGCGECEQLCRFSAISVQDGVAKVNPLSCEGCGVCADHCPEKAIDLWHPVFGHWFESRTRFGPLVHARLAASRENSGKLVTTVRTEAKALAQIEGRDLVLVDGSPGVGCAVIASVTTADLALVVAEPTPSGLHDVTRVFELTKKLKVKAALCVNKADLNPAMTSALKDLAAKFGVLVFGEIRYDAAVTKAQVAKQTLVEYSDGPAAQDVRALFKEVMGVIGH